MPVKPFRACLLHAVRQRSLWIALLLWVLLSLATIALCHGKVPLPGLHARPPAAQVIAGSVTVVIFLILIGIVALIARRRPWPNLAERAPDRATALRETIWLWIYGALVIFAGRWIGLHFFGGGIALHLNGSLVGPSRVQSPIEVYTWAAYNGFFLAFIPYLVFRLRGYSREALNLKSSNLKNDTLIIVVVLAIGCAFDLSSGHSILQLTPHQQLVGGLLSFVLHLFGTGLPIMIFIYAILLPRYFWLVSPMTAFLLGAASYPTMHIFESWTLYDTLPHAMISVAFVFLTFFPAGLVKSYLTMRTGNAWVHLWAFHVISPHVTLDTRLVVNDFHIQ
ncbi:MAG: hypothetical protein WA708_09050 [Acidobacteriaceae bacterium]